MQFAEYNHVVEARAGYARTDCIGKSMMPAMFVKSSHLLTRLVVPVMRRGMVRGLKSVIRAPRKIALAFDRGQPERP